MPCYRETRGIKNRRSANGADAGYMSDATFPPSPYRPNAPNHAERLAGMLCHRFQALLVYLLSSIYIRSQGGPRFNQRYDRIDTTSNACLARS